MLLEPDCSRGGGALHEEKKMDMSFHPKDFSSAYTIVGPYQNERQKTAHANHLEISPVG